MDTTTLDPNALALFNRWQRDFPLCEQPFDHIGAAQGLSGADVRDLVCEGLASGQLSRLGAVFGVGAGGAGVLCALQVPPDRLEAIAERVNEEPCVSHNYEREHAWNMWFVACAADDDALRQCLDRIETRCGVPMLRLPMRRAYRIDLGFDLFTAGATPPSARRAPAVEPPLRALAARLEDGLELVDRPYEALGAPLGLSEAQVLDSLRRWCAQGTVRRLGFVLRHHEFGISANAMTVFRIDPADVDAAGQRLAAQPGVTLCYQRANAEGWPYTLYCMVHGRERAAVRALIDQATEAAGLSQQTREVLFSTRRFKQTGSRYFARATA